MACFFIQVWDSIPLKISKQIWIVGVLLSIFSENQNINSQKYILSLIYAGFFKTKIYLFS